MSNRSTVTEFLLRGFSDMWELQVLHFVAFLVIYLMGLLGNLLIISAIGLDHRLHTPMYFFLVNLSSELGLIAFSLFLAANCFVFIVVLYVQIFKAVLRVPSEQGRHKAFSTCLPHLAVVSLLLFTSMFNYLKSTPSSGSSLDLMVGFLYAVVPPMMNPVIYSMRNKELKAALKKLYGGYSPTIKVSVIVP